MSTLSPDGVFVEAHRLFIETFDRQGLRLLLFARLKVKLYQVASPNVDDSAICMGVLEWAQRSGRLSELVRAAAAERPQVSAWQALRARVPVPPDELLVETHRLIVRTFSRDDLQVLLRTKLEAKLNTMTTPMDDDSAAALDVVEWFENRYRLCELIRAAAGARNGVPEWQLLLANHCA